MLRPRRGLVSRLHRCYFSLCDAFLAIGRANADLYRAAGVPECRIITAGYFVDNDRFAHACTGLASQRTAIRRAWSIPDNAICFAFVGKLEPKKSVLHALEGLRLARERGKPFMRSIVGTGRADGGRTRILRYTRSAGVFCRLPQSNRDPARLCGCGCADPTL